MSDNNQAQATENGFEALRAVLFERDGTDSLRNIKFFVDESCVTKDSLAQAAASYIEKRLNGTVSSLNEFPEEVCSPMTAAELKAELGIS